MGSDDRDGPAKVDHNSLTIENLRAAAADSDEMREILENTRIVGYFAMRTAASDEAKAAQAKFRRMSQLAIFGAALATLASGLLLYGAGAATPGSAEAAAEAAAAVGAEDLPQSQRLAEFIAGIRPIVLGVQIVGAFITAFATAVLSYQDQIAKWTDNRRRSGELRRQIFVELFNQVAAHDDAGTKAGLLSKAFKLFCTFQLKLQINYYDKRRKQAERSSSRLGYMTAALAGVTAVIGIFATLGDTALVIAAFLGIAVPVMLAATQSWRTVNLFGDKAKSYEEAYRLLTDKALQISEIDKLAAAGDVATVRGFVDEVHEIMVNENTNWVAASPVN